MLTEDDKKNILHGLLEVVQWISDKTYQQKAWIYGTSPGTDFDETVNYFFCDADGILEKHQDFMLSDKQYVILKSFTNQFRIFSDNHYWPSDFIDTPEWDEITKMAKEVLRAFHYGSDKSEDAAQP